MTYSSRADYDANAPVGCGARLFIVALVVLSVAAIVLTAYTFGPDL